MTMPSLRWLYGTDEPSRLQVVLAPVSVGLLVLFLVLLVVGAPSPWTEVVEIAFYASLATIWYLSFRRRRTLKGEATDAGDRPDPR